MRRQRVSHLRWVRIGDTRRHPRAQRDFRQHRAEELAAKFNLEGMGFPVLSKHDDIYLIIDGQHRLAALLLIGFPEDDVVQCEVYEELDMQDEAELFLERNDGLHVAALDKFKVGVTAGRHDETEIDLVVRSNGLKIGGRDGIKAVSALIFAYKRTGAMDLGKTLRVIRDAYGTAGFESAVLQGTALAVQRYDGKLDEEQLVKALAAAAGGLNGLLTQANKTREQLGQNRAQCIAATEVAFYNRVPGGKRVPGWWKDSK